MPLKKNSCTPICTIPRYVFCLRTRELRCGGHTRFVRENRVIFRTKSRVIVGRVCVTRILESKSKNKSKTRRKPSPIVGAKIGIFYCGSRPRVLFGADERAVGPERGGRRNRVHGHRCVSRVKTSVLCYRGKPHNHGNSSGRTRGT